jgi:hypothetical protein
LIKPECVLRASSGSEPRALKKYLPGVRPARDLDARSPFAVEVIVDRVRVSDEVALVAGEQAIDGLAVVLVAEKP